MSQETYTLQSFRKKLSITIPKYDFIWGSDIKWICHDNNIKIIDNKGEMPINSVCTIISKKYNIGGLWVLVKK